MALSPTKPVITQPTVARMEQTVDSLQQVLAANIRPDGTVDLKADPLLADAFSDLSGLGLRRDRAIGDVLAPKEVKTLVEVLTQAKARMGDFDANDDGSISWTEGIIRPEKDVDAGTKLAGRLIQPAQEPNAETAQWMATLKQTETTIHERASFDLEQAAAVSATVQTLPGSDAVQWAYREKMLGGDRVGEKELVKVLEGADESFMSRNPVLKHFTAQIAVLDDKEVMKLLGTDDLAKFTAETKARVEAKLGMRFLDWLEGKDLPGHDQLSDPDYRAKVDRPPFIRSSATSTE